MPKRLARETSPYLQQHADNPVDWYPWNDETLRIVREQDKPILLSIGYSACHWCHVMAYESFEDCDVAAVMNAHFINIKVDREERPEIRTNSSDIFAGVELSLFPLLTSLKKEGGGAWAEAQWKACQALLGSS